LDLNDNKDIFRLDLDSMTLTNLTNSPENNDFDVSWSPDGQWIVFCSVREDADGIRSKNLDDSRDLFLMRPDGSQESRIVLGNLRTFDPNWSPNGQQILFGVDLGENIEELWLFQMDGGSYTSITPRGAYFHPEWYP
jgi:Tol biopolymer transport system component